MIHILIYEDDKDLREGIAQFLVATGEFLVEGKFSNCDTIAVDIKELKADIILMDIDMPGCNGIEGVRIAKAKRPEISILMFTVFDDEKKIFDAICAGADGYLLKKTPPDRLIEGLKDVYNGGAPMTPSIARKVLQAFPKKEKNHHEPLTEKELEILQLLVQGNSYKQVAESANISIETVRTHIKHIYSKLHVRSMSQAVAKAINQKIV
ncbi:MAG TPA: response regulator transcription factor [Chitinophagaceae bacterium]